MGPCDWFKVSFGIPLNPRLGCFFEAMLAHLVQPPMAVTPPPPGGGGPGVHPPNICVRVRWVHHPNGPQFKMVVFFFSFLNRPLAQMGSNVSICRPSDEWHRSIYVYVRTKCTSQNSSRAHNWVVAYRGCFNTSQSPLHAIWCSPTRPHIGIGVGIGCVMAVGTLGIGQWYVNIFLRRDQCPTHVRKRGIPTHTFFFF